MGHWRGVWVGNTEHIKGLFHYS